MKTFFPVLACVLLAGLFASPAFGCSVCSAEQTCESQDMGQSGNCYCKIRHGSWGTICTPVGVCDPNDVNTCAENDIRTKAEEFKPLENRTVYIPNRYLDRLAERNILLAVGLYGGVDVGANEGRTTTIRDGEFAGRYKYSVFVEEGSHMITFSVRAENFDTGEVHEFDGGIWNNGLSGEFDARKDGAHYDDLRWSWKASDFPG